MSGLYNMLGNILGKVFLLGRKRYFDYSLLLIIIFLTLFGLIMIYSASSYNASVKFQDSAYFLSKQAKCALIGFVLMIIISFLDYHAYTRLFWLGYGGAIALMIVTFAFGRASHGARRWIYVGSLSIQPAEIVKVFLIVFLAAYLYKKGKKINSPGQMAILALFYCVPTVLVMANNWSSGFILLSIAFVVTFVATKYRAVYAVLLSVAVLVLTAAAPVLERVIYFLQSRNHNSFRFQRILVWLDPEQYRLEGGFQVLQGLYAVGTGGFLGKGLGQGLQKLTLPEAQNDMIFAIICEELGLFGAALILICFGFLLFRCLLIATSAPDLLGSLLVIGVIGHVAVQVIFNVSVVTNMIPNTGVILPFISAGGTSLIFLMCEMGMVLGVSRTIKLEY